MDYKLTVYLLLDATTIAEHIDGIVTDGAMYMGKGPIKSEGDSNIPGHEIITAKCRSLLKKGRTIQQSGDGKEWLQVQPYK